MISDSDSTVPPMRSIAGCAVAGSQCARSTVPDDSSGWAASADIRYAIPKEGASIGKETTEMDPVVGLIFGQQGLIAGASLAGVKYTRIIP